MIPPPAKEFSLIDLALADQRDMSAVEWYSKAFEISRERRATYRALVPLTRPGPGEQYAFVVDMDRCSGCKACVSACHSLNGLEDGEMWRSVGTLIGEDSPYLQTITASCHHCVDPACASGCPVLAYEKDPVTGIVRHLDDQCIGCQYCVLKCPYDAPKYSSRKGIVRKCDMCQSRLADGEAPACAQACPHEAIRIEITNVRSTRAELSPESRMIPGAFPSSYTVPTTIYVSAKGPVPPIRPACTESLRLEKPHWPLIWMLVLTQMAAGIHFVSAGLLMAGKSEPPLQSMFAALVLGVGLVASVFHLGRPLKAWRAFLGWRRSWMSREIVVFGGYSLLSWLRIALPANTSLAVATGIVALLAVFSSSMIYVDTRRQGWPAKEVFPGFFGTASLLGFTAIAAMCADAEPATARTLILSAALIDPALLAFRVWGLFRLNSPILRLAPGVIAGLVILCVLSLTFSILALLNLANLFAWWIFAALISRIAAQILDRWIFFVGTPAPRMPGAFSP